MKILIAGGTGLIGTRLTERLLASGHKVTLLSRNPSRHDGTFSGNVGFLTWDGRSQGPWSAVIEEVDGVVNLSGAGIGDARWTTSRKILLLEGRVEATRAIVEAIGRGSRKPSVLVNASAVGFYGDVPNGDCAEDRSPGDDFLSRICVEWEKSAMEVRRHGVRVAIPRSGIVLASDGGAFPRLLLPFRLFAGGPLGSGKQWFPWVHIQDEVDAIIHALTQPSLQGPFNVAAPEYVRMKEFAGVLGRVMGRPSWAPAPSFILRLVLGEMAGPLLLSGQRAVSDKLQRSGYTFSFPEVRPALVDLLSSP